MADCAPRARGREAVGGMSRRESTWLMWGRVVGLVGWDLVGWGEGYVGGWVGGWGGVRFVCGVCLYKRNKRQQRQTQTQTHTHLAARDLDELGHDLGEAQGHGVLDLELQALELVEAERLEAPAARVGWCGCDGFLLCDDCYVIIKGRTHASSCA